MQRPHDSPCCWRSPVSLPVAAVAAPTTPAATAPAPAPAGGGTGGTPLSAVRSGEGTFYGATGAGNCSFDASPQDLMVAAMNQADYAGAARLRRVRRASPARRAR